MSLTLTGWCFLGVVSFVDTVLLLVLRFPLPLPLFLYVALVGDPLVGLGSVTVAEPRCLPRSDEFWGQVSVLLAEVVSLRCPLWTTGAAVPWVTWCLAWFG